MITVDVHTSGVEETLAAIEQHLVRTMARVGSRCHQHLKALNPVLTGRSRSGWMGSVGVTGSFVPAANQSSYPAVDSRVVEATFLANDGRRPNILYNNTPYMDAILDRKDFLPAAVRKAEGEVAASIERVAA